MKIEIIWSKTIVLIDGISANMVLLLPLKYNLPTHPGIYIFGRKYGESLSAIYIGKADNIKGRVEQQLNNVKLMMALKNSGKGNKVLSLAE